MNPLLSMLPTILKPVARVVDQFVEDKDLARQLNAEIQMEMMNSKDRELEAARDIIVAEATSGAWLKQNWRPLTMVTFVALIVAKWLGFTAPGVTPEIEMALLEIIKIGLGGYVVGRSGEKIIKEWKKKE